MSNFEPEQVTQLTGADIPDGEYDGTWWRVRIDEERAGVVCVPGSQEVTPDLIAAKLSHMSNGPEGKATVRGLLERGRLELSFGHGS